MASAPLGQLVAVQAKWSLADYRNAATFGAFIERLMDRVDAIRDPRLPCLVAFPEFIGLPLLFMQEEETLAGATGWRDAIQRLAGRHPDQVERYAQQFRVGTLRALLLALGARNGAVYTHSFSRAASRHGCYLAAGSIALPDLADGVPVTGAVYNVAYLFGPDGSLLGTQKKVHPYGREGIADGLDLVSAGCQTVRPIPTEFGKVGIAICYDAWHEDVISTLEAQGARILVQPSANAHPWDEWQAADWKRGLWRGVRQHSGILYGVNPMMVGSLFAPGDEFTCQGRSSIVAGPAATPDNSGYLALASEQPWGHYLQEEIISALVRLPTPQAD